MHFHLRMKSAITACSLQRLGVCKEQKLSLGSSAAYKKFLKAEMASPGYPQRELSNVAHTAGKAPALRNLCGNRKPRILLPPALHPHFQAGDKQPCPQAEHAHSPACSPMLLQPLGTHSWGPDPVSGAPSGKPGLPQRLRCRLQLWLGPLAPIQVGFMPHVSDCYEAARVANSLLRFHFHAPGAGVL